MAEAMTVPIPSFMNNNFKVRVEPPSWGRMEGRGSRTTDREPVEKRKQKVQLSFENRFLFYIFLSTNLVKMMGLATVPSLGREWEVPFYGLNYV